MLCEERGRRGVGVAGEDLPARGLEFLDAKDENIAAMLLGELAESALRSSLWRKPRDAASSDIAAGYEPQPLT